MKIGSSPDILLVTPPLTQVNTPYPATQVLKGFLSQRNLNVFQIDLGLELFLHLLTPENLKALFKIVREQPSDHTPAVLRTLKLEKVYLNTVLPVIRFLQNRDLTLAHRIVCEGFLPEGPRFDTLEEMDWAFGTLGIQDRARFTATLYLEDIADLVKNFISERFGFSRYAERLALSATWFKPIEDALQGPDTLLERLMLERLDHYLKTQKPDLVGFTIPFPGCLYSALKCGQFIKANYPSMSIMMGGGYISTELRDLKTPLMFKYTDFVSLDDGELPSLQIAKYLNGEVDQSELKRTFFIKEGNVRFSDNQELSDIPFSNSGVPDYRDLPLGQYLSILEIANPMHRLWSDGRWNKLTLAHGCYWKKCAFCDLNLDYISRFEAIPAKQLVDRIEKIIDQTGQSGFHFVDEAAPPHILLELAIEILKRGTVITWWTNIRFENRFSKGLCELLAASGCIAVSGGLETASDRLLQKMKKRVSVAQAARVANNLQNAGIMVHAYLMYGFPTQTNQETINALEVIRQFFHSGLIQSAFWHRFALTQHSPIGNQPEKYEIQVTDPEPGDFALNDLQFKDPLGAEHSLFSNGLNKAVYNYMHGIGLDYPMDFWFDFDAPATTVEPATIENYIQSTEKKEKERHRLLWLGSLPELSIQTKEKKGKVSKKYVLILNNRAEQRTVSVSEKTGAWLIKQLKATSPNHQDLITLSDWKNSYETSVKGNFSAFLKTDLWKLLTKNGLLLL